MRREIKLLHEPCKAKMHDNELSFVLQTRWDLSSKCTYWSKERQEGPGRRKGDMGAGWEKEGLRCVH